MMEEKVRQDSIYTHNSNCCIYYMLGDLCSQCKDGHGISLDLRKCVNDNTCGAPGVIIFVLTCKLLLELMYTC